MKVFIFRVELHSDHPVYSTNLSCPSIANQESHGANDVGVAGAEKYGIEDTRGWYGHRVREGFFSDARGLVRFGVMVSE